MQTIIKNAHVYLQEGQFADAIYIEDGIIKAVGTLQGVRCAAEEGCQEYDAAGATVIPGFNDSHLHLLNLGTALTTVNLSGVTSKAEVKQRTLEFLAKNQLEKGAVVQGRGWNQDYFTDDGSMLTRQDLDDITTEHPLVFTRACGHIISVNSAALEKAGVDRNTPQPAGASFDLDDRGEPSGIFREAASMLRALSPSLTKERVEQLLRPAVAYANQHGITSLQTNDIHDEVLEAVVQGYEALQHTDPAIRVYHQSAFSTPESYAAFVESGHGTGAGNAFLRYGPLKLFVDGSLGGRTAHLRQPYADAPATSGISVMSQEDLDKFVQTADRLGCQVAVHAIGDAAIEKVLNSYEALGGDSENPRRHGVIHVQITDRELVQRFADRNILAYVQPIFIQYDAKVVEARVGKEMAASSYAFHTLHKIGASVMLGTDCPVEDLDPIANLHCAVTRTGLDGFPAGGYVPGEKMSVSEAVDLYTQGSAYASFEEDVKGRIAPGFYADLTFLDQDIFSVPEGEIKNTKILATMVDGRFVYQREQNQ